MSETIAEPVKDEAAGEKPADKSFTVSSSSPASRFVNVPALEWVKRKTPRRWPKMPAVFAPVAVGVGLSAVVGFAAGWIGAHHSGGADIITNTLSSQKQIVTSESQLITKIASTVGPSVVSVNVTGTSQNNGTGLFGFGMMQPSTVSAAGTGIILSTDGLVITNRHVVPAGTTNVSVTLSDGTELNNVTVLGRTSSSSSLDIAFLKINDTKGKKLTPAVLGDSSKVQVGDDVVAIGNALGQFQNTVTSGIISGYGRSVQASASTGQDSENLDDLFQTDAAINEGNSGGPLVNLNGQVIGINTATASSAQNIGFAIPINDVTGLIEQVKSTGKLQQPYLGVYYIPVTDDIAQQYSLHTNRGAWVPPIAIAGQDPILAGGPAAQAGLQAGDIITQIDGTTIDQNNSLTAIIGRKQVGQTVDLTVVRDGNTMHVKAKLSAAPADSNNG